MKEKILYIVATVISINDDDDLFGDIILVTENERHAKTIADAVKRGAPLPALDYSKLAAYDDCVYFQRTLGYVITTV